MPDVIWADLKSDLERLESNYLYRDPEIFSPRNERSQGSPPQRLIDFSSNDYLSLSQHPKVAQGARSAIKQWGTGSGASRLLSVNLEIHTELEKKLAHFKKEEAATVFSSGYLANLGVLSALANEKDIIFMDRLNHASLFDGAKLSKAKWRVYPHRDLAALERILTKSKTFRRKFVVTDAYFSMDGTVAPLDELLHLCGRHGAILVIDEAHSTGVFGKNGRGLTEQFGIEGKVPVVMGTLSKALGSVGGFIAGKKALKETLHNFCRPYIYTTAPSPPASAAALSALEVIEKDGVLRKKLWENIKFLREALSGAGFDLTGSEGPIIPIRVGDVRKTLRLRNTLTKAGFIVSAIRPPTVPKGTDRLRLSVTAAHRCPQIISLVRILKKAWSRSG